MMISSPQQVQLPGAIYFWIGLHTLDCIHIKQVFPVYPVKMQWVKLLFNFRQRLIKNKFLVPVVYHANQFMSGPAPGYFVLLPFMVCLNTSHGD